MSHYSDDYEYDANKRQKETQKELEKFAKKIQELKYNMPRNTPTRFKDFLEDMYNWSVVNSKGL